MANELIRAAVPLHVEAHLDLIKNEHSFADGDLFASQLLLHCYNTVVFLPALLQPFLDLAGIFMIAVDVILECPYTRKLNDLEALQCLICGWTPCIHSQGWMNIEQLV